MPDHQHRWLRIWVGARPARLCVECQEQREEGRGMERPMIVDYWPDRPKAASGAPMPRSGPEVGAGGRSRTAPSRATVEPEPPDGTSREQFTKAMLKAAYRGAGSTPINDGEESATGRCLHPRFTWHLEALHFVREPYLTRRQVQIMELIYRDDRTPGEVAQRLNCGLSTVKRDRHDALEVLIRIAWNDPGYSLPYPVYTRSAVRERIADHLRDLGV